jgi:hypothetical protein
MRDYPADLDVEMTLARRRWLPLVAWLLVLPHVTILGGLLDVHLLHTVPIGDVTLALPIGVSTAVDRGRELNLM